MYCAIRFRVQAWGLGAKVLSFVTFLIVIVIVILLIITATVAAITLITIRLIIMTRFEAADHISRTFKHWKPQYSDTKRAEDPIQRSFEHRKNYTRLDF